ncbi:MAG TPA: alpha/beta hydrolase [Myxococcota bacterium]|nr:alpha/beta hydrolase [Myxococcota bacterium]
MMPCEELRLQSLGLSLAAKAWGPVEAPPLLALHGWLDNAESFTPLSACLQRRRLVALDLPGHGASQHRSPDAAYHFIDWIPAVMGAVRALGWETFDLVGHSLGAGIAMAVAGTYPDRVRRLALIDSIGPLTATPEQVPERLARHVEESLQRSLQERRPYATLETMAATLAKVVPRLSAASARLLVSRGSRPVNGGYTWAADNRLRGTSAARLTEAQVEVFLRRIACPVLHVHAPDGYPVPTADLVRREACVARLRRLELAGGHHVHMERPEAVGEALSSFLDAP